MNRAEKFQAEIFIVMHDLLAKTKILIQYEENGFIKNEVILDDDHYLYIFDDDSGLEISEHNGLNAFMIIQKSEVGQYINTLSFQQQIKIFKIR